MPERPNPTKIYHITHVENLPSIAADGGLVSDAMMIERGGPTVAIGMGSIKQRRMALPVKCHTGDTVGEYVPFFFCPRSVMLYLFYRDNLPDLTYHGGQEPIVHLELDVDEVTEAADEANVRWAFTNANAATAYAEFGSSLNEFDLIDWDAVPDYNFSVARIKEAKQSEFLVKDVVPWELVERIGVYSESQKAQAIEAISDCRHQPPVVVKRDWYF